VQWLTTLEAADYLGKTAKAMQMMRYQHSGPAYQRNGNTVRYKSTDLDAWLATKA
jgi:excisionase family DNA binding protein